MLLTMPGDGSAVSDERTKITAFVSVRLKKTKQKQTEMETSEKVQVDSTVKLLTLKFTNKH